MIQKIGSLNSTVGPILVDRVLTNSLAVAVGYAVQTTSGFLAVGTAGARVLGHVVSFIGADSLTPVKDGTYLGNPGEVFTAESDNQTVDEVRAQVDVSVTSLYSAELDATAGTTTGSDLAGYYVDLADKDTLDESTVTESRLTLTEGAPNTVAIAQYYSHGLDRNDTTQVVVNIVNSEVFGI